MQSPKVYVILPVRNRADVTCKYLDLLLAQTYKNIFVIVIDDGSTDSTVEQVERVLGSQGTVLEGNGNLWWAGGLQKGFDYLRSLHVSESSIIYVCNDDISYEANFLEMAVKRVSKEENSVLSAVEYDIDTKELISSGVKIHWKQFSFSFQEDSSPDCFSTRSIFLTYRDLLEVGGMYPKLLPHYFSDYEFTYRARQRGKKLIVDNSLKVYVDTKSSGIHKLNYKLGFFSFFKQLFSRRSAPNPFYKLSFIFLCRPGLREALGAYYIVLKSFYRTIKRLIKFKIIGSC